MSSTQSRRARKTIAKTTTLWRVVPMEVKESDAADEHGAIKVAEIGDDSANVQIIDTPFEQCVVVHVPPTTSYAMAREIEQRLMGVFDVPAIVMSSNLVLCRVEGPLSRKEVEATLHGVNNVDPAALADALVRRTETADAEDRTQEDEEAADIPATGLEAAVLEAESPGPEDPKDRADYEAEADQASEDRASYDAEDAAADAEAEEGNGGGG